MKTKKFNLEIYNLMVAKYGTIDKNFTNISFTVDEFERFMGEFVKYCQQRQMDIVKSAERKNTYMGEDVPSFVIIGELDQCIWIKE